MPRSKLAVCCCVHDDAYYLAPALRSFAAAGPLFAFVSRRPWNDRPGDWEAAAETAREAGAEVVLGDWDEELAHREAARQWLATRGFTHAFIPDGDEIVEPALLEMLLRVAKAGLAERVTVEFDTYWKSPEYVIRPREALTPQLLIDLRATRIGGIRIFEGGRRLHLSADYGVVHHLSYAGPDERIRRKLETWSHRAEVRPGWWEEVWLRWDRDRLLRDLHPTHPRAYGFAERIPVPGVLVGVQPEVGKGVIHHCCPPPEASSSPSPSPRPVEAESSVDLCCPPVGASSPPPLRSVEAESSVDLCCPPVGASSPPPLRSVEAESSVDLCCPAAVEDSAPSSPCLRVSVVNPFPSVSVVIPLHGGVEEIRQCLDSLEHCRDLLHEVVVVDDASPDEAPTEAARREWVKVVPNGGSRGFAAACNRGFAETSGELVLFLNSDTVVPRVGLERLVEALQASASIGAAGPYTNRAGHGQQLAPTYTSLATLDLFAEDFARREAEDLDVDMLVGFCLLARRTVLEQVAEPGDSNQRRATEPRRGTEEEPHPRASGTGLQDPPLHQDRGNSGHEVPRPHPPLRMAETEGAGNTCSPAAQAASLQGVQAGRATDLCCPRPEAPPLQGTEAESAVDLCCPPPEEASPPSAPCLRASGVNSVQVFDERFGIGMFEDNDLCYRIRRTGYRLVFAGRSFVHHHGHRTLLRTDLDIPALLARNERLFFEKWERDLASGYASHLSGTSAEPLRFDPARHPDLRPVESAGTEDGGHGASGAVLAWFGKALQAREWTEAEAALRRLHELEGLSEAWAQGGARLAEAAGGDPERFLRQVIEGAPLAPGPRMVLARRLLGARREEEAVPHLTILARRGSAEAAYYLGIFSLRRGNRQQALVWMERALQLNPGHPETSACVASLRRGP